MATHNESNNTINKPRVNNSRVHKTYRKQSTLDLSRIIFPKHPKCSVKPIIYGLAGLASCALLAMVIDKKWFSNFKMIRSPKYGWFLLSYLCGIFMIRAQQSKSTSVFYEALWGCNIGLFIASVGFILGRPMLVGIAIGLVGLDQTVWYLDVLSFFLRKKYLVGAAGYLSHPEQTFIRSITSLHHLWFLPYAMYGLHLGKSSLHPLSFPLSMFLGFISMIFGRICPKFCWMPLIGQVKKRIIRQQKENKKHHSDFHCLVDGDYYLEYLNVNCGHEFYPTVKIPLLHFCNKQPAHIYLAAIGVILIMFSYIPFYLMSKVSDKYLWVSK